MLRRDHRFFIRKVSNFAILGSALCPCNAGYTGTTGDVCVACVAGKYKNLTGPLEKWKKELDLQARAIELQHKKNTVLRPEHDVRDQRLHALADAAARLLI